MDADKNKFLTSIIETLRNHPEWIGEAIQAFARGADAGVQTLTRRAGDKDMAMLAALCLVSEKRITDETRQQLNKTIQTGLNPKGHAAPIEDKWRIDSPPPTPES